MDISATLQSSLNSLVIAYQDACANPKPNYTTDGKTVAWGDYLKMLSDAIQSTSELMGTFNPVEIQSIIL